jgi:hypothetical protein
VIWMFKFPDFWKHSWFRFWTVLFNMSISKSFRLYSMYSNMIFMDFVAKSHDSCFSFFQFFCHTLVLLVILKYTLFHNSVVEVDIRFHVRYFLLFGFHEILFQVPTLPMKINMPIFFLTSNTSVFKNVIVYRNSKLPTTYVRHEQFELWI